MTNLSYRIEGEGSPLLLIHGMGISFTIWKNLVPLLSPHYKLIMIELPGHGCSKPVRDGDPYYSTAAQQIERLRQELDIQRWNLLGYSLGARVAQIYVCNYPERIEHGIFVCPAIVTPAWATSIYVMSWIDQNLFPAGDWMLSGWRLPHLVRLLGFNGRNHPYVDTWTREIASQPVSVIKQLLYELPGSGRAPFNLPPVPVLFIWGDRDTLVEHPRRLRPVDRMVPGDHSAPMLAAPEIAREIISFLQ